jgi:hypothetical protein
MRCRSSSLRPNGMGCSSSHRREMPQPLTPSGGRSDAPQSIGVQCRNPSPRPSEMSELLTEPEWNGMLPMASEGSATTPHRLGEGEGMRLRASERNVGTPHCAPMRCQNFSLRPNEMGCSHRIGRECHPHSPPGRKWDAPQSIGVKCQNPSLRPNEMPEVLTSPGVEWEAHHRVWRECRNRSPPREEMGCPSGHRSEVSEPLTACHLDARTPHCARMKWDAPHRIGGKCPTPLSSSGGNGIPLRASE